MFSHYRDGVQKLREYNILIDPDMDGRWRKDDVLDEEWREKLNSGKVTTVQFYKLNTARVSMLKHHGSIRSLNVSYRLHKDISLKNGEFESISLPLGHVDEGLDDLYCWLPTEFEVAATGGSIKIVSDRSWDWNRYSAPQWGSCGYELQNEVGWRDPKTLAQRRLEGKTVKVMTRLLKISLLSEDAHYPGDEWHVDGMMNEFRVASGIYNYAKENITDFSLRIRHQNYYHTMPYYDGIRPLRIVDDYAPALMKVEIITSWKLKANSSPDPSL
ncbi:hypothetical protein TWF173_009427 [Orbilia oligospora]|nr:hypothetical protein TWF173_009427 [Orbilia oligospora]